MDVLLVFTALVSLIVPVLSQTGTDLTNLKTQLFTTNSYNTKVRPVTDQATVTAITVDFALVGINSFSDTDQKLTTTGYLTLKWTDELLVWTAATYSNLATLLIPQNNIWRPDITLDNGLSTKAALGQKFIQATILNTGAVTWSPYEVFDTSCSVSIANFPFDKQICEIRFATWIYDNTEVLLSHGTKGIYTSNFEKNGKWDLETMTTATETVSGKTVLVYKLTLVRKPSFYILFLILPAVLLSLLNCFVFVLPAGSGEKVGYSISVFLSYALFYTILSESLPKNSDTVSTVAAYLFFMMFLSTLGCVVTIIQLRIYNKDVQKRLPLAFVKFVKCVLHQRCSCCTKFDVDDEDLDGEWTRVIGPWLECDWHDFVDALDFVLFWIFMFVTVIVTIVTFIMASSRVTLF